MDILNEKIKIKEHQVKLAKEEKLRIKNEKAEAAKKAKEESNKPDLSNQDLIAAKMKAIEEQAEAEEAARIQKIIDDKMAKMMAMMEE